ncbi:MAG: peptidylprolyl isomerase [Alphaproteobacteria bacterium]|nr:peptidylprolyl isomerase [Alphaproteobacteria bacterium]
MMKTFSLYIFALFMAFAPVVAHAGEEGIAAVVNDDIVTTTDLRDRAEMLLKSSGKAPSPEMLERVKTQVLEGLIAETVQLQEAKKQGAIVTDEEVNGGFKKIAENNKLTVEQFKGILTKQGIRVSSIERQIRAQLGWGKVIQQVLRPRVVIGPSEIKAEKDRLSASAGKKEYFAAEIFLPVSAAADDARVRALAQTLANQIRKGKKFMETAREQSQSASAAQGGIIGWVQEGQLEPAVDRALAALPLKQVSDPVKGDDGYYLLYVNEARTIDALAEIDDAVLDMRELVIDGTGMREKEMKAEAERIAKDLTGCIDIVKVAASDKRYKLAERKAAISELTDSEKALLGSYDIGRATPPEYTANKSIIRMVCSRSDPKGPMANDAAIERKLGLQRLDMLQKRYLRDLIGTAYIERRV